MTRSRIVNKQSKFFGSWVRYLGRLLSCAGASGSYRSSWHWLNVFRHDGPAAGRGTDMQYHKGQNWNWQWEHSWSFRCLLALWDHGITEGSVRIREVHLNDHRCQARSCPLDGDVTITYRHRACYLLWQYLPDSFEILLLGNLIQHVRIILGTLIPHLCLSCLCQYTKYTWHHALLDCWLISVAVSPNSTPFFFLWKLIQHVPKNFRYNTL